MKEATILIDKIDDSPFNPRKAFARIEELAESVKKRGILQPVLVRPAGDRFELVCGHRRKRAASLAGLKAIPAVVQEMTDAEAAEVQVVENLERETLAPLEEAEAYRFLTKDRGVAVVELATRFNRSEGYILQRLALLELPEPAKKALSKGELHLGVALLLARIPDAKLRKKASDELLEPRTRWVGNDQVVEPFSVAEASSLLRRNYMTLLQDAPFDTKDEDLVAGAGACAACPKRTANQRELFSDVAKDDLCSDPGCFDRKREAAWKRIKEAALERGDQVLDGEEAKKVFAYGRSLASNSGFVDLEEVDYRLGSSWKKVLGKDCPKPTIARDLEGGIRRLVPKKEAEKLAREKGKLEAPEKTSSSADASMKESRRKEELRRRAAARAGSGIVSDVRSEGLDEKRLRSFVCLVVWTLDDGFAERVSEAELERLVPGWANLVDQRKKTRALAKALEKAPDREVLALLVSLFMPNESEDVIGFDSEAFESFAEECGFKLRDVEKVVEENDRLAAAAKKLVAAKVHVGEEGCTPKIEKAAKEAKVCSSALADALCDAWEEKEKKGAKAKR